MSYYFSKPRLRWKEGYNDPPLVDDELLFDFPGPPLEMYHGRLVRTARGCWELWSPNSPVCPYYPGVPPDEGSQDFPKYFDGHLGRYDFTVSPQVFSPQKPWLPFIIREAAMLGVETPLLEFYPVQDVLESRGRFNYVFQYNYVYRLQKMVHGLDFDMDQMWIQTMDHPIYWENRPLWPSAGDIASLDTDRPWRYEDALDQLMKIQRGIKEQKAWMTMIDLLSKHSRWDISTARTSSIKLANPEFIGTWVNGADEYHGLWLLTLGVPCYVIHELNESELQRIDIASCLESFTDEADTFHPSGYPGNIFAYNHNCPVAKQQAPSSRSHDRKLDPILRQRSSSEAQGWWGPSSPYHSLRSNQSSSTLSSHVNSFHPNHQSPCPIEVEKPVSPKIPVPKPSSYSQLTSCEGELVRMDDLSYWVPPPVMAAPVPRARGKKKQKHVLWLRFVEVPHDFCPGLDLWLAPGRTAMVQVGNMPLKADDAMFESNVGDGAPYSGRHHYWDRKRERLLSFNEPLLKSHVYFDDTIFGLPLPDLPYFISQGKNGCTRTSQSTWAYAEPTPTTQAGHQISREECMPSEPKIPQITFGKVGALLCPPTASEVNPRLPSTPTIPLASLQLLSVSEADCDSKPHRQSDLSEQSPPASKDNSGDSRLSEAIIRRSSSNEDEILDWGTDDDDEVLVVRPLNVESFPARSHMSVPATDISMNTDEPQVVSSPDDDNEVLVVRPPNVESSPAQSHDVMSMPATDISMNTDEPQVVSSPDGDDEVVVRPPNVESSPARSHDAMSMPATDVCMNTDEPQVVSSIPGDNISDTRESLNDSMEVDCFTMDGIHKEDIASFTENQPQPKPLDIVPSSMPVGSFPGNLTCLQSSSPSPPTLFFNEKDTSLSPMTSTAVAGNNGRYRGGIRNRLYKRFGLPFWDLMDVITEEQIADLSEGEKRYIATQLEKRR